MTTLPLMLEIVHRYEQAVVKENIPPFPDGCWVMYFARSLLVKWRRSAPVAELTMSKVSPAESERLERDAWADDALASAPGYPHRLAYPRGDLQGKRYEGRIGRVHVFSVDR